MSATFDFSGKVVLITGGTRGLGRAMAQGFADAGADVIVSSRKAEACQKTAADLRALGVRAEGIPCHVGEWEQVNSLAERAWNTFGWIDVLINNAGMSPLAPSSVETSEALFDKVVAVNFKGAFRLSALIGSRMAAGDGGSIINISSTGTLSPRPEFAPYAASKAALNTVSVALAKEFAPKVRVNVISPGSFATDIADSWQDTEAMKARIGLKRFGEAQEIVGTALYLAGDMASYTTGANIRVDGGSA